jgi:DNA repair exonuclease SbcCD ATPase subunit
VLEKRVSETQTEINVLQIQLNSVRAEREVAQRQMFEAKRAYDLAVGKHEMWVKELAASEVAVKAKSEALVKAERERLFVKAVREARPAMVKKIWDAVLVTASEIFTAIREGGDGPTVLTRDDSGFYANGLSVKGLSGGALSMLGLSLRFAMQKLFMPSCPFMILDEPCAALDAERTVAVIAQLQGLSGSGGLGQIILITHEDVSSGFCDKLIDLS